MLKLAPQYEPVLSLSHFLTRNAIADNAITCTPRLQKKKNWVQKLLYTYQESAEKFLVLH